MYLFYAVVAFAVLLIWAKLTATFSLLWQMHTSFINQVLNIIAGSIYIPVILKISKSQKLIRVLKQDITVLERQLEEMKPKINFNTISRNVKRELTVKR